MIRRIVEDYEAKLVPTDSARAGAKARGKAEWERYSNDEEELSVSVRNLDLPDGTELDAYLNGGFVGRLVLRGGYAKVKLESKKGDGVPRAGEGSTMTVSLNGTEILRGQPAILLAGTFVRD